MVKKMLASCLLVAVALGISASVSYAQYNPYLPRPGGGGRTNVYNPYVYAPYAGPGGYLAGGAQVMQATGQLYIDQEKARVEREKALQAQLDTKKQAFDQMLYEKAMTPTFQEDQKYVKANTLQRVLTNPFPTEITGGKTLNFLNPYVIELSSKGIQGPPTPIDSSVLQGVNITPGSATGTNVNMLKPGREIEWPIGMQGPLLDAFEPKLTTAISQVSRGKLQNTLYQDLLHDIKAMREDLKKRCFREEKLDTASYLEANRFLDKFEPSVRDLARPSARKLFTENLTPSGRNVPELAAEMTQKGWTFGPALPGEDASYQALHSAYVAYVTAAQTAAGFQLQLRPTLSQTFQTNPMAKR